MVVTFQKIELFITTAVGTSKSLNDNYVLAHKKRITTSYSTDSLATSTFIIELPLLSKPHYSNITLYNVNRTVRILGSLLSWRLQVTGYSYTDDGSRANSWVCLLMIHKTTLPEAQIMQCRRLRGGLVALVASSEVLSRYSLRRTEEIHGK
jgi:hypothetical protein